MKTKFRESETLELKQSTSQLKEAIVSIVSILNKHGFGELYFGIKDDGTVAGQDISGKTLRDISQSIAENIEPKIYPEIKVVKIENKNCIYIKFSGDERPYYAFGRVYTRVSDEDRKLSAKEIENIILKKHTQAIAWESQFSKKDTSHLDGELVKRFVEKGNAVGRLEFKHEDMETTLRKLGLIEGGRLLNASEALFCDENPLEVQMAIFAGKEKLTFLDIKQMKGNVFDLLDQMELYIQNHIKWRVEFGKLEREEIPEIPVDAVRESLVNSLCHRNYRIPKSNEIAIFRDRIEIYNPGTFPEGLTPQDFIEGRERSVLRNPLIAQTLYLSKDVEKWGSGLKRIYEDCLENRVSVEFWTLQTGFMVIFYRKYDDKDFSLSGEEVSEYVNRDVNEDAEKLYDYIKKHPGHKAASISEALNIPLRTAERWIRELKSEDKIEFIGSKKAGAYYPKKDVILNEEVKEEVNEYIKELYDYIKKHPGHKAASISEALAVPLRTVERWIKKLRSENKIEFVGSKKAGGYYPKEKPTSDG